MTVAHDGETALAILRGQAGQPPLSPPYLILLDLYLPQKDGFTFLQELRQDPDLATTIVFVLTLSTAIKNQRATYQHGIAGYLTKEKVGWPYERLASFLTTYCRMAEFL